MVHTWEIVRTEMEKNGNGMAEIQMGWGVGAKFPVFE